MRAYIRAGDLRIDDVVTISDMDCKVVDTAYYKKQGRKWVNLVLLDERGEPGQSSFDRAVPVDVIVPWRGTALF